jgi:hypothetical protein
MHTAASTIYSYIKDIDFADYVNQGGLHPKGGFTPIEISLQSEKNAWR